MNINKINPATLKITDMRSADIDGAPVLMSSPFVGLVLPQVSEKDAEARRDARMEGRAESRLVTG